MGTSGSTQSKKQDDKIIMRKCLGRLKRGWFSRKALPTAAIFRFWPLKKSAQIASNRIPLDKRPSRYIDTKSWNPPVITARSRRCNIKQMSERWQSVRARSKMDPADEVFSPPSPVQHEASRHRILILTECWKLGILSRSSSPRLSRRLDSLARLNTVWFSP
ncbi:hypothetical protein PoB_001452200 [Plakobranchus ocellatus]|uniref:Uncharacterized protein n=1 Tax=Plakobranchus ocellatus TaxID=259542 RepID=A0AAV3Z0G5_9GAST|nr:hypothetical protein PoB_001452200 [Plakobranchus ocellatus]